MKAEHHDRRTARLTAAKCVRFALASSLPIPLHIRIVRGYSIPVAGVEDLRRQIAELAARWQVGRGDDYDIAVAGLLELG